MFHAGDPVTSFAGLSVYDEQSAATSVDTPWQFDVDATDPTRPGEGFGPANEALRAALGEEITAFGMLGGSPSAGSTDLSAAPSSAWSSSPAAWT